MIKRGGTADEGVVSIDARLDELGRKMDRLRSLYESFFMGTERMPPNTPRRELNRLMLEMQQEKINNATLRFRFQSLQQRWVLFTTHWNRTLREIEAGTYRRDIARAHRHLADRGGAITEQEALQLGIPASRVKAFVGRQAKLAESRSGGPSPTSAAPPPPPAAAAAAPAPADSQPYPPPSRLSEKALQSFYQRYREAHVKAQGVPPRATDEQLRERLEKLLAGQPLERVEIDVAVENGKVKVRARPGR